MKPSDTLRTLRANESRAGASVRELQGARPGSERHQRLQCELACMLASYERQLGEALRLVELVAAERGRTMGEVLRMRYVEDRTWAAVTYLLRLPDDICARKMCRAALSWLDSREGRRAAGGVSILRAD